MGPTSLLPPGIFSSMGTPTRLFDPNGLPVVFRYIRGSWKTRTERDTYNPRRHAAG